MGRQPRGRQRRRVHERERNVAELSAQKRHQLGELVALRQGRNLGGAQTGNAGEPRVDRQRPDAGGEVCVLAFLKMYESRIRCGIL